MAKTSRRDAHAAAGQSTAERDVTPTEYEQLANFRYTLRRFFRQTELEARRVGISPQQYQLMLAIKGFPERDWANITELAERLQVRHNAVIGLVNRCETRGLVLRKPESDANDRRIVQIHLTPEGEEVLRKMVGSLHDERVRVMEALNAIFPNEESNHH